MRTYKLNADKDTRDAFPIVWLDEDGEMGRVALGEMGRHAIDGEVVAGTHVAGPLKVGRKTIGDEDGAIIYVSDAGRLRVLKHEPQPIIDELSPELRAPTFDDEA